MIKMKTFFIFKQDIFFYDALNRSQNLMQVQQHKFYKSCVQNKLLHSCECVNIPSILILPESAWYKRQWCPHGPLVVPTLTLVMLTSFLHE